MTEKPDLEKIMEIIIKQIDSSEKPLVELYFNNPDALSPEYREKAAGMIKQFMAKYPELYETINSKKTSQIKKGLLAIATAGILGIIGYFCWSNWQIEEELLKRDQKISVYEKMISKIPEYDAQQKQMYARIQECEKEKQRIAADWQDAISQKNKEIINLNNQAKEYTDKIQKLEEKIKEADEKENLIKKQETTTQVPQDRINNKLEQIQKENEKKQMEPQKELSESNNEMIIFLERELLKSDYDALSGICKKYLNGTAEECFTNTKDMLADIYLSIENKRVHTLQINKKQLEEIPEQINKLQLCWLNLSNNKIKRIENLENQTQLQMLNISRNRLTKIENLENQTQLQWLHLSYNPIAKIENLDKNLKLTFLYIFGNPISENDPELIKLKDRNVRINE